MQLDPKSFGLSARTIIKQIDESTIALIIDRKSRIIMADGRKILERVAKIRALQPGIVVQLITTAPVCSKTTVYLESEGIKVIGKR